MKRMLVAAAVLVASLGLGAPAYAQLDSREAIQLQNQILEMRRDVQTLRDQVARGAGSSLGSSRNVPSAPSGSGDMTASLLERVGNMEDQLRRLQGRIDEIDNARQRGYDDLAKQIGDLNFKIDNGGSGSAAPAGPAARPSAPGPTALTPSTGTLGTVPATPPAGGPPVRRTPEVAMQQGNAALARRDYPAAEAAAREVLAGPKTPRSTDAQFLLAQAMTGKKDYTSAAVAYDDAYNRGPTGTHAQDSLLGLANSLTAINEKKAACATLDKLKATFPNPRQDLREPVASARQRAGCK